MRNIALYSVFANQSENFEISSTPFTVNEPQKKKEFVCQTLLMAQTFHVNSHTSELQRLSAWKRKKIIKRCDLYISNNL